MSRVRTEREGLVLHMLSAFLFALMPIALGSQAVAQQVEPYEYARPGRPTMTLYVWGAVSRPGIWHVEREATLVEILSLINVQGSGVRREGVREKRFLRVYRDGGASPSGSRSNGDLVYEALLEDVLPAGQLALEIRDGDVLSIEVETHEPAFTLRNVSSVIGTAASLALLIIRLASL